MAYLNVRERRIEARIAYVGPALSGKSATLDHLRNAPRDARIARVDAPAKNDDGALTIAWQPVESDRFRDCSVLVKVVAQDGAGSVDSLFQVVREADGVVLVVDAHPDARERNRASMTALRDAFAKDASRKVPLVVQVNKSDLADAMSTDDVADVLAARDLKLVATAAPSGRGVVDALEAALQQVFASLQSDDRSTRTQLDEEAHPLLGALRQVLRETVTAQADELERRVTARIEASLARIETQVKSLDEAVATMRGVVDVVAGRRFEDELAGSVIALLKETDARVRAVAESIEKVAPAQAGTKHEH